MTEPVNYTVLCWGEKPHVHLLPLPGTVELRTVVRCDECGAVLWLAEGEYGYQWYPLRWYHWRLRRCLKEDS